MTAAPQTDAGAPRRMPEDEGLASVTRQGVWALVGVIGVSLLGFAFWWVAGRIFDHDDVGIASSLTSLSLFGAALAIVGLDAGIMRFAPREIRPRRLIRTILLVTALIAGSVGIVLPLALLTINDVESDLLWPLVALSLALTVWTVWSFVTTGALIAARKARVLASQMLAYGGLKLVLLIPLVSAGVVGLFAAYTIPMLALVVIGFLLIVRYWPAENPEGTAHTLREVATLSMGNWIYYLGIALPTLSGPAFVLTFFGGSTAYYFFLALQLAEILNYGAEALSKSLLTHGSWEDRLTHTLTSRVWKRVLLVLTPLVAAGIVTAPFVGLLVAGPGFAGYALFIQLFLLATLPRSSYQILLAQFNVDRRPRAVAACGATFGLVTFAAFVAGLVLQVDEGFLPTAWLIGGIAALSVGLYLLRNAPQISRATPSPP
jgi:O-antigen/teichoic acid export membrane protein